MKPIDFKEVDEFQDITVNDIPALYTDSRVGRDTLPVGMYAYEIRSGEGEAHATIEEFVRVNHTATIVTMQHIPMTEGDFTPIVDIDFLDTFENVEDWKDRIYKELAESGQWRDRAIEILEQHTSAHNGDIIGFVNEYWQNLENDEENLREFRFHMRQSINENLEEPHSFEGCDIMHGVTVYWKDPAGETSGLYTIDGDYPFHEEIHSPDERIIDITNKYGSRAQVLPWEIFYLGKTVMFRKHKTGNVTALFPKAVIDYQGGIVCEYRSNDDLYETKLAGLILNTVPAKEEEYKTLQQELESLGIRDIHFIEEL